MKLPDLIRSGNLDIIRNRKIGIVGYGSQGKAQALNLRDSGVNIRVGLREGSASFDVLKQDRITGSLIPDLIRWADVIMLLVGDDIMPDVYQRWVLPHLKSGQYLGFSHGYNIHYKKIILPDGVEGFLVAPKSVGPSVRKEFLSGRGVPCVLASLSDRKEVQDLALSYAGCLGGFYFGCFFSSFAEETEADLFSEQAVLCGGLPGIIKLAFKHMVENGISPIMAYFECVYEVKLIADLLVEKGLSGMEHEISSTAAFGGELGQDCIAKSGINDAFGQLFTSIRSGEFSEKFEKKQSHISEPYGREKNTDTGLIDQVFRHIQPPC